MTTKATFTLWEIDVENPPFGGPSYDVNGGLMTFATFDDAVEMARFIVEDPESFPLVGINQDQTICDADESCELATYDLAHDRWVCPVHGTDCENEAWSVGWVKRETDGSVTIGEGDYEDDVDWESLMKVAAVREP